MAYLRAKDTINGALGTCFALINGNRYEIMQAKNVEAKVEKTKSEIPILGLTSKQHKAGGWKGTGTMEVYYVSSLFRQVMLEYFELLVTNEDPTSETGKQTVLLKGVNIDSMLITKLDVEKEALDETLKFTFNDADLLEAFEELNQVQ